MEHQKTDTPSKESIGASDVPQAGKVIENADVAVLSMSSTPLVRRNPPTVIPAGECRRSSRKKIIKFDVRDLLNKNRKPHKIQIEARIDSNVPNTPKACGSLSRGESASTTSGLTVVGSQDLSSKQKAFMEKSAIFRRFSISQDQTKPPPPPPLPLPPTILGKAGDTKDIGSMNVTGKRLNRSQEYYKNALLKPKHTTSLIVAQVESNVRSVELKIQTNHKPSVDGSTQTDVSNREPLQQKKRGRPPKIRSTEPERGSPTADKKETEISKLSPEKATNWKEYKACLAEQYTKKIEVPPDTTGQTKSEPDQELSIEKSSPTNEPTVTLESKSDANQLITCLDVIREDHTETKNTGVLTLEEPSEALSDKVVTASALDQEVDFDATTAKIGEIDSIEEVSCFKQQTKEKLLEKNEANKTGLEIKRNISNIDEIQEEKELKDLDDARIAKECLSCEKANITISKVAGDTSADMISEEKSLSLRRSSLTSENSGSTSLSSMTGTSICTSSSNKSSWSEVTTSKGKNSSSSPDEGRKLLGETKRSKRLQKRATDMNRKQKTANNNKDRNSKSSNDSENSLHEDNIIPENEKSCDASIENSSSDSLSATYMSEFKDNESKGSVNSEKTFSNDSKSSNSKPKEKVNTPQRKSLRKRKEYGEQGIENIPQLSPKIHVIVQKNDHTNDITQADVNKDETKQQDIVCLEGEKFDSKEHELVNKEKLQEPNSSTPEVLYDAATKLHTTTTTDHSESDKKGNTYKTADEESKYENRKGFRKQRDDSGSSSQASFDENEHNSEPSNIEVLSKNIPQEETMQSMEENNSADKATYFKRKSPRNPKDNNASSSEENSGNHRVVNILEEAKSKEENKTKLEISIPTVRKSLRKQKDGDISYSSGNVKHNKSPDKFKTKHKLLLHTPIDSNSQQTANLESANTSVTEIGDKTTNIETNISTQRMSLRKHKDEDKPLSQNIEQDKLKTEENIDDNLKQSVHSTTILNDLVHSSDKEDFTTSTNDDLLSPESYRKSSETPTSTQRMSLRNQKVVCANSQQEHKPELKHENSQNATGKDGDETIQSAEIQTCTESPKFTQKKPSKNQKVECEPSSPGRTAINVTQLTLPGKKLTEEHQACISKSTSTQLEIVRNAGDESVHSSPEGNIIASNDNNSQHAAQSGITLHSPQYGKGTDVCMTALASSNIQPAEENQTCIETPSLTQRQSLSVLKEDKVPHVIDKMTSEISKTENDFELSLQAADNYSKVQSKSATDKSKSVTRKSSRKQKDENVSHSLNIECTNIKGKIENETAKIETKESLDNRNKSDLPNETEKIEDVSILSHFLDVGDIKERSNNENDPAVNMPTTEVYQTLQKDVNVVQLCVDTPTVTEKTTFKDQGDATVAIVGESEDIQNQSGSPQRVANVSLDESPTPSENVLDIPTKCISKQKAKRTSLRKQKETLVLSNNDTLVQINKEKDLLKTTAKDNNAPNPTEDQLRKSNSDSFGCDHENSSTSSSLEYFKKENQMELSKTEHVTAVAAPSDANFPTDIDPKTTTACKDKRKDLLKTDESEPTDDVSASKDVGYIENDTLNKTYDKDNARITGAHTPDSEYSQASDESSNVKRKRTRKSRFKNLHGPDSDPENALGSGDKKTPATELSEPNETHNIDSSVSIKENAIQIIPEMKKECKLEISSQPKEISTTSTAFDSNKGILETTTNEQTKIDQPSEDYPKGEKVLDVVESQSNESPQTIDLPSTSPEEPTNAYVIQNLSIETNTLLDILRTVQCNEEAAVEAKKSCDSEGEKQDSKVATNASSTKTLISQKKFNDSNSSSPCRSDSASPITHKKIPYSPCRSDTSSPMTLKKCNSSPSRSDTSSPLSVNKKITRRYERRNRRGDESTHKTLEETFAEIAALSSKAVLEMSSKDDDIKEERNAAEENKSNVIKVNEQDINESEIEQCGIATGSFNQSKPRFTKDEILHIDSAASTPPCSQDTGSEKNEQCTKDINILPSEEVTSVNPEMSESNNNKSVSDENPQQDVMTLMLTKDRHQENKQKDEKPLDGVSEKCVLQPVAVTSLAEEKDVTKIMEEECVTPKSSHKKRDPTFSKNECKSVNKKSSKKSKSPENIELVQIDSNTCKSTTPPPKRGRKPKSVQTDTVPSPATSSGGKKKVKKEQKEEEVISDTIKDVLVETEPEIFSDKSIDEKLAKKKRQRKLKEAFEAALNENPTESIDSTFETPSSSPTFDIVVKSTSHLPSVFEPNICENTINNISQEPAIEPEVDPDPLKDIEKFIEDGVNLLKKAYKIDEDSVDNVIIGNTKVDQCDITSRANENDCLPTKEIFTGCFETPADTPLATPSVTPPPKSPESSSLSEENSSGGVRRSHRIKLITKTPKALVGRGLVRDKERFSIKDDVETKSHYTLDDHLLDLAEVEAKNAKFLKEMEERLSNFQVIKENEYKCERVISREARKMICDCFLTADEEVRGELACGEDCLNRLLMIECGPECNVRERCTNKRFQKLLCSPCRVFRTEKKGFGILADIEILPGEFIMEYVGEVIDTDEFERRRFAYSQDKNRHYYFMALRSDAIIDATIKGNISRFINHSCDPNAETQKWTVNGELRIGFFSRKSIMPGEEITFNYQYQRYGREAQRCYCESFNCRGWIGQEPTSDEGEQVDDDDESDEEEYEEEDNANLLEEDDDDSDASVSDPEEVQKKLEMAAAQAAAELAPIALEEKPKPVEDSCEEKEAAAKSETEEEDSKSKFKKLLSKMAEKVAAKHKQTKREQKLQRKKKSKESSSELTNKQRFLEDPDIEDEVEFLSRCGLKNQSDTLRLSRLMVRAKLVQTRLNLLGILRKGELPCRRLFLDYHGLRLVHGWMSEDAGNMQIRLALLQTLELLPIANKTMLTDSKVMQVVRSWCSSKDALSPNDDSLSSNSNSQDGPVQPAGGSSKSNIDDSTSSECGQLQKLALKLVSAWDGLAEIFRIPKKERIEQMKEHEREADRQYAETEGNRHSSTDMDKTNRFGKRVNTTKRFGKPQCSKQLQTTGNTMRSTNMVPENLNCISKAQRREMFAAKVARDEAEKRMAEERREFETKCRFFGLDPKKTRPQDVPFCVNPATGQWYSVERKPINTPPSYAHVQVPEKNKSTNPVDYQLPAVCATLPPQWKYAITPLGQIYYYHVQYRVPQWELPTPSQLHDCEINIEEEDSGNEHTPTTGPDSSDDDDDILVGMDATQLKAYIERKVESRRQKRYQRLVDERAISPRREEDRVYNQLEVRKYKENKEKIRKRKEEIRRKRAEALRQSSLNMCTLGSLTELNPNQLKTNEAEDDVTVILPIQDYLLSSDEDEDIKLGVNSPLIDKIVEGDKIVDELDALTTKRPLKRPLPPHREIIEPTSSSSSASVSSSLIVIDRQEYKKRKLEKKDKRKPKEQDAKYRKTKEKFRCEIAGIIVHHLKPYRKDSCSRGRIQSNDDFNHLARKLTHFVMIKELKYCDSVGQTLVVTESVKNKSREFIKKYMTKYGDLYVKPSNDPEFKDIPFTL